MGIIQKQAVRNTVFQLFGNIFGAFTRLLMPIVLSEAQIGLVQTLEYVSGSFRTIFNLGFNQILTRMFPHFRDEAKGHHGFLAFGIYLSLIGFGIALLLFGILGPDFFVNEGDANIALVKAFMWLVIPRMFFEIIFYNLDGYARMLFNSVIGAFLESLLLKVVFALSILLFYLNIVQFEGFLYLATIAFCLPGVVIIFYSFLNTPKISLPSKNIYTGPNRPQLLSYMFFGILSGATGTFVMYIDSFMVSKMISLEALGVYATLFFAARLIIVPSRAINRIANTILAESWKEQDLNNILVVYKKSCLNQMLIGGFFFVMGWGLIDATMDLSPKFYSYQQHLYVFFFLGLATLIEMSTGANAGIIATSEKYKMNTYFNLILVACLIVSNFIFIKFFQLEGAAIASLVATAIINFIRWLYLKAKYQLQPFDINFLKALFFVFLCILLAHFLHFNLSPVTNIILKGIILFFIYWCGVIFLQFSKDINDWVSKIYSFIRKQ